MKDDTLSATGPLRRVLDVDRIRIEGRVASSLAGDPPASRRFEGMYGAVYDRVIKTPAIRRTVFGLWGSADPLLDLDAFVSDAVRSTAGQADAILVDVPCGGGTLLPLFERERFRGTVVEADLAATMLARALRLHATLQPRYETVFLRSDALDLPLRSGLADVVISVNGLHVLGNPERFLSEIARVTKPGGGFWIITPVDGPGVRSRMILAAANSLSVTPAKPPTRGELQRLLAGSGFDQLHDYGGESIAGFGLRRRPT